MVRRPRRGEHGDESLRLARRFLAGVALVGAAIFPLATSASESAHAAGVQGQFSASQYLSSSAASPDGHLYVTDGQFLYRLTSDAVFDSTFGQGGKVPVAKPEPRLTADPSGGVLAWGADALVRYLPTGQPDPSFGTSGVVPATQGGIAPPVYDAAGRILVRIPTGVVRLLPNGKPDPSFGHGGGVPVPLPHSDDGATVRETHAGPTAIGSDGSIFLADTQQSRTSQCDQPSGLCQHTTFSIDEWIRHLGPDGGSLQTTVAANGIEEPAHDAGTSGPTPLFATVDNAGRLTVGGVARFAPPYTQRDATFGSAVCDRFGGPATDTYSAGFALAIPGGGWAVARAVQGGAYGFADGTSTAAEVLTVDGQIDSAFGAHGQTVATGPSAVAYLGTDNILAVSAQRLFTITQQFIGEGPAVTVSIGSYPLTRSSPQSTARPVQPDVYAFAADGGVFTEAGNGVFCGSTGNIRLNRPVVGGTLSPSGIGYWEVASDGGIFSFGDAHFWGSTGAMRLNQPVVGMAATPTGRGYWLVASDGGIFSFGDAHFWGSTGAIRLNRPIVGMATTPTGRGYWLVASDGGIFNFGDAPFNGSTGAARPASRIVSMATSSSGRGYTLLASDGTVYPFGDAATEGARTSALTTGSGSASTYAGLTRVSPGRYITITADYCTQCPLQAPIVAVAAG